MRVRERIKRCRYCKREVNRCGLSFAENPFCNVCLPERVAEASRKVGPRLPIIRGKWLYFVPVKTGTT